jgi:transposase-like protein
MSQHFLLAAKARTLSLGAIMRMSDDEAHAQFEAIRFAANGGAAFCPACECTKVYTYRARKIWKCAACLRQFSVTSGTIFANRKLPIRDYLAAIAIFVNAVKGISALQLGRDLDVQFKTAFVLAHKLREAMSYSPDSAARRSANITTSAGNISLPTRVRWRGRRTIGGAPAGCSMGWRPVPR